MSGDARPVRFITLEGGEGAGKSTQIKKLSEALEAAGVDHIITREPGGSQGAEEIRSLLVEGEPERWDAETEVLLHYAARRDHLRQTVKPALKAGKWVICDRYADSTMAYQGYGHGVNRNSIAALYGLVADGLAADLTLIFDLPVEQGQARAKYRAAGNAEAEDRYENMDTAFHQRIRDGFLAIAKAQPDRCVLVDAAEDVDTVAAEVKRIVFEKFGIDD